MVTLWDVAATLLLFAAPGALGALLAIACGDL
jgi:hypothetical protein